MNKECSLQLFQMADFVREHLANVQIVRKDDLETGNTQFPDQFAVEQKVPRHPGETDADYGRRLRKLNYLSLAQEFAELKKVDIDAVPFDVRCGELSSDASPDVDPSSDGGLPTIQLDAEVYVAPSGEQTQTQTAREAWTESTSDGSAVDVNKCETVGDKQSVNKLEDQTVNHHPASEPSCCDNDADKSSCIPAVIPASAGLSQLTPGQHGSDMNPGRASPDKESECVDHGVKGCAPEVGNIVFDVYNIETTMPDMDWSILERHLELAAAEEEAKKKVRTFMQVYYLPSWQVCERRVTFYDVFMLPHSCEIE